MVQFVLCCSHIESQSTHFSLYALSLNYSITREYVTYLLWILQKGIKFLFSPVYIIQMMNELIFFCVVRCEV